MDPARLLYQQEVVPALVDRFGYKNSMQVPKLEKIVLNIGLGEALDNSKAIENATGDLTKISGQKPVTTLARKSIAAFKIREGMPIGVSVTLRGFRMYEFLDRLVNFTLPQVRDFRGARPAASMARETTISASGSRSFSLRSSTTE